jgi:hypothetical protein
VKFPLIFFKKKIIPMKSIIILLFTFQILFKNYKTHLKKISNAIIWVC